MQTMLARLGLQPLRNRRRRAARLRRNERLLWSTSFVLGNAAMYYLDPGRGAARRARVVARSLHTLHLGESFGRKAVRDLRHRGRGLISRLASMFRRQADVPDALLQARVRSKLGHVVTHPRAIEVTVRDGRVTLLGNVAADELKRALAAVRTVPGASEVDVRLGVTDETHAGHEAQRRPRTWSPGVRLLIGGAGLGLIAAGLERHGMARRILGAIGAMILVRDFSNRPMRSLAPGSPDRNAFEFQKTITIAAPVETVFAVWADPVNLPKIMSHVYSVTRIDQGIYRWTVAVPAGLSVSWHAAVTDFVANERIAWASLPGEIVANSGTVRFDRNPDGSTRLDVKMSYAPIGGVIGHAIASVLGADPKHVMDADLVRFKSLLEDGRTRAHGQVVTREEIEMDRR